MNANQSEPNAGFELNITRTFDAPRELVWQAWTDPVMAKQWMGPRGFTVTEFETSTEPGSSWHLCMEGTAFASREHVHLRQGGRTLECVPPEKLVYTFAWDDRSKVGLPASPVRENVVTVRFEAKGNQTVMHFTQAPFATEGERDGHNGGWNSTFDRFFEFLLAAQPARKPEEVPAPPSHASLKHVFAAPPERVFAAWTNADQMRQWWGPTGFECVRCEMEPRSGGHMRVDMQAPDGKVYAFIGTVLEAYAPERLHFRATPLEADGTPMMEVWHTVFLAPVAGGTELTLDGHVPVMNPIAEHYLRNMNVGWDMAFAKLTALLASAA